MSAFAKRVGTHIAINVGPFYVLPVVLDEHLRFNLSRDEVVQLVQSLVTVLGTKP